jgi:hypothetical protein
MKIRLTAAKKQNAGAVTCPNQRTADTEVDNVKEDYSDDLESSHYQDDSLSPRTDPRVMARGYRADPRDASNSSSSSSSSNSSRSSSGYRQNNESLHKESANTRASKQCASQGQYDKNRKEQDGRMLVTQDTPTFDNYGPGDRYRTYSSNRHTDIESRQTHDRFEYDVRENRKRDSDVRDFDGSVAQWAPDTVRGSDSRDMAAERSDRGRERDKDRERDRDRDNDRDRGREKEEDRVRRSRCISDERDEYKRPRREDTYRNQDVRRELDRAVQSHKRR